MEMYEFFKSVLDQDKTHIVICDLNHTIVYMNECAITKYSKYGGNLVGRNLLNCHNNKSAELINKVVEYFKSDISHNMVHTSYNEKDNRDVYIIALRNSEKELIGYYEKHEYRTRDESPYYDFS